MPRRSTRRKIQRTVPMPSIKNSHSAEITENVEPNAMNCEIIYEGTKKSTLSTRKPSVLEEILKSKELCNGKLEYSTVHCTPVIKSPDKKEAKKIDKPSPQVMLDPDGYVVLDERSLLMDNPFEPEVDIVYENAKKRKTDQWTLEDTKRFYASLGTVQTDFSAMSHLFGNSRSRRELKLKFKLEEKKHKDLVEKALSQRCNVGAVLNEKLGSSAPVNQNSSTEELNEDSSTMQNGSEQEAQKCRRKQIKQNIRRQRCNVGAVLNEKLGSSAPVNQNSSTEELNEDSSTMQNGSEQEAQKCRRKQIKQNIRRIRRFYFSTSSDEDDVQVISSIQASCKQPSKLTGSSQPPLSKPDKNGASQPEVHFNSKSATCALDDTSINGFNIRRPKVVRVGENGKKWALDACVTDTEDEVVPLVNLDDILERFNRPEVAHVPSDSVLELLKSTQKTRPRRRKTRVSSSSQNNCLATSSATCQKVSKRNPHVKANGELDIVKLLLGHLEDVSLINPGNERFVIPESESNVLRIRRSSRIAKKNVGSGILDKEPDVEVVFENVLSPPPL